MKGWFQPMAYPPDIQPAEAKVLAQYRRIDRACQQENGFTSAPEDMNMGWRVIVRVDHHPKAVDT